MDQMPILKDFKEAEAVCQEKKQAHRRIKFIKYKMKVYLKQETKINVPNL